MKKQLFLLLFSIVALVMPARTVTGTVIDPDGEPAIGASVTLKGHKTGVSTDIDGKYSINVPDDNAQLTFSLVGAKPMTVKVGSRSVVDVTLSQDAEMLDDVVVTAMGQSQAKSKLNFGVQELKSDEVLAGQSANFVNSLQGKVAGVQVSNSGGSPNSASQIVIRAISSINNAQSNEPLFVIDGMPIRGGASSMADINASDIETMSVLKGAAASALYGQEGANGVILITTKSGKDGKVNVTVNGGWEISNVLHTPWLQDQYIGGANGIYTPNATGGWGPLMNAEAGDKYYDNVGKFLGTGFMQKYDISLSGGNEKYSAYASANYMDNEGVVPHDYKKRLGVFVKGEFNPSKTVKIMLSTNFIDNKSRGFGNSMSTVYGWAINRDMSDYKLDNGLPNWANRYDNWDLLTNAQRVGATLSPYYGRYMDKSESQGSRVIVNGSIAWEPVKNLTFTGKVNYDKGWSSYESSTVPRYLGNDKEFIYDPVYDEKGNYLGTEFPKDIQEAFDERMGTYVFQPSRSERFTAQFLANYYWKMSEDFNLNFFAGAEYSQSKSYSAGLGGYHFMLNGDFISMNNLDNKYLKYGKGDYNVFLNHAKRNKYGYFGEIRFDYRNIIQASVTGRLDGSSTLKQVDSSYFYPSFTGGIIFTELFKIQSPIFNYGKIRGNWAKVGKDAPANQFSSNYKQWSTFPDGGYGVDPTLSRAITLEPEMTKSWEIGADLRFFNNRTRLDVAYYNTTVDNQIVTVRVSPSSGTILQTRNEGSIENHGLEFTGTQEIIKSRDINWTATVNLSFNRGKVKSLPEDVAHIQGGQYGDIYTVARLNESTTGLAGNIYEKAPTGEVLIDEQGYPRISSLKEQYIGNREPDCLIGLGSTFSWKDASISFLLDGRIGGDVANVTGRGLMSNGRSGYLTNYRNRKVVFKGLVENADGTYTPNTKAVILDQTTYNNYISNVSENFIEDGSYLRMSYVTVAYDFSNLMRRLGSGNPVKGLKVSLTGRNLFLFTKYTGADPQVMPSASNGTGSMGIDNYSVPSLRSFNFNVNVTF